jgi:hypothetical protein
MNALKNRIFQLATGLLTLGAIGLLAPRVAHAVVATLVQVANTASNPVVNSEVSRTAAQTISVYSGLDVAGDFTPFREMIPGGGLESEAYVVPADQSFVITEIDIGAGLGGAFQLLPVTLGPNGESAPQIFQVPGDNLTHQFVFPNGIVWPPGQSIPFSADPHELRYMTLRGYLTRN